MLRCTAHLVHSPQPLRLNSTILAEYHFTSLSSVHLSTQDLLSHGTLFVETSMNVSVDQVRVPQVKEHICTTWVKCFPLLDLFFHLRHQVLLIPLWTSYMEHWLTEDWGLCSGPSAAWCKWISWCTVRRSLLFRWQGMVLLRYPNQYKVEDRLCKTARTGRIVLLGPCWRSCSPKATWSTWFSCSRLEWFVRWSVGKLLTTFHLLILNTEYRRNLWEVEISHFLLCCLSVIYHMDVLGCIDKWHLYLWAVRSNWRLWDVVDTDSVSGIR